MVVRRMRRKHAPEVRPGANPPVAAGRADAGCKRLPVVRSNAWLLLANLRYWPRIAPVARAELRRWERSAVAIAEPASRSVALEKLRREGFNAEVAATLAVFAPRARRALVARTIVALEVLYDYLDGLAASAPRGVDDGRRLFAEFLGAFMQERQEARERRACAHDDPYAAELAAEIARGLRELPRAGLLLPVIRAAAARTAEGQIRSHALPTHGREQLERWARNAAEGSGLRWPEFAAGAAASVLAVHALVVAGADERTTAQDAHEIDAAYLTISAVSTMLDSVNDYRRDIATGRPRAVDWYDGADVAPHIASLARRSLGRAASLPNGPRHAMVAAGVIAYYTSPPEADRGRARAVARAVRGDLRAILWPTLAVMRTWRAAKRARGALARSPEHAGGRTPGTRSATSPPSRRGRARPLRALAGVVLIATLAAAPALAASHARARAARTISGDDNATLHFVRARGSTLYEEGQATGSIPGHVRATLRVEATFSGTFTISTRNGSFTGSGTAKPHGAGAVESFSGTFTITGGTGRYAHARGHGELYGTFRHRNYEVVLQPRGTIHY